LLEVCVDVYTLCLESAEIAKRKELGPASLTITTWYPTIGERRHSTPAVQAVAWRLRQGGFKNIQLAAVEKKVPPEKPYLSSKTLYGLQLAFSW
jgi:hypothetical protein